MICLTIDCEQWNSPGIRGKKAQENNNTEFSRLGNEVLLEFLEKHKIKATFFVTGFFAEREHNQIKNIVKGGHEIACHGYNHYYRGNKNLNLKEDIVRSKKILEKIIKKNIRGFRAPQMQYSDNLLRILHENKFKYDSSLNPAYLPFWINNSHYPLHPFKKFDIIEAPVAVIPTLRLPMSWFFIRLLPYSYLKYGVRKLFKKNIAPILYVHSWEFIELRSSYVPWYFTKNTGKKFIKKLSMLVSNFKARNFTSMENIVNDFYHL